MATISPIHSLALLALVIASLAPPAPQIALPVSSHTSRLLPTPVIATSPINTTTILQQPDALPAAPSFLTVRLAHSISPIRPSAALAIITITGPLAILPAVLVHLLADSAAVLLSAPAVRII